MPDAGQDFLLPDLGEGLEDATIVRWLVAVGDRVALNQPLCIVETAKAEVEVPSPHAGTIVQLGGADGDTLLVGALLTRIDTGGGPADRAPPEEGQPEPTLVGYGRDEAHDRSRRRRRGAVAAERAPTVVAAPPASTRLSALAKPPVRLLARRLGLDLTELAPGSGPRGIVTRADVEAAAARRASEPGSVADVGANGDLAPSTEGWDAIPVRGIRARVAERLTASRADIPDATCSVVVDCTRLLEVRAALNERAERQGAAPDVTPFSLLAHLTVHALGRTPILNSTYDADGPEIRVHRAIDLGIGTATERGLVVTVVHDAAACSAGELARRLAGLSEGARAGTLAPADLQGSTFTISNFGALGLDEGIPIINHPEAAILGVGSIRPRPHVVGSAVVARPTASLTLVFDHRVCDGVEAGGFLGDLRAFVEAPELALL
jgi:pyruvate dehydrogenase E2 component (dihydrolipoamide acetyltransferase)